jgi:hypothetical protein
VKDGLFAHVCSQGLSVQRENLATDQELADFVTDFLERQVKWAWVGVLTAPVSAFRSLEREGFRDVCAYDTGERTNPSHGELMSARTNSEDDKIRVRKAVKDLFRPDTVTPREAFRQGQVWRMLSPDHQARPIA